MNEQAPRVRFLSDFDGTAVRKYPKRNLRSWSKYPLAGIPGYADFVAGVQETGISLDGVATVRKKWLRRFVTERSVLKLGYGDIIFPGSVRYAGNEEEKGRMIANETKRGVVGMIDDKPHKIGKVLLAHLAEGETDAPIVLGVVEHKRTEKYLGKLLQHARSEPGLRVFERQSFVPEGREGNTIGFTVDNGQQSLHVVRLGAYQTSTGRAFGRTLLNVQ